MRNLIKKLKNKKGFTLMEMLIVVAIMVILVAVSIPVFTSQLNKAKEATDSANVRAAKSVIVTKYLTGGTVTAGMEYNYDADLGDITTSNVEGYGQASGVKGEHIDIKVDDSGNVSWKWSNASWEADPT